MHQFTCEHCHHELVIGSDKDDTRRARVYHKMPNPDYHKGKSDESVKPYILTVQGPYWCQEPVTVIGGLKDQIVPKDSDKLGETPK